MPEELNELENQPQDQPPPESQDQPGQESEPELTFDRVLSELPEDRRKVVEEGYLRNKDYTHKQQRLSEERKRLEAERASNRRAIEFHNRFVEEPEFRRQVLASIGEKQIPQRSDNFDERYEKAQEIINNLDKDSRIAIDFMVEKKLRDSIAPINEKLTEFERQQEARKQEKLQRLNMERQQVLRNFAKEHPDYVDVEPAMENIISGFPGFFNQTPAKLEKALKDVYRMANLPKTEQKAKEKGIQQMLNQSVNAQKESARAVTTSAPRKTFSEGKKGMSIDECFDKVWGEKMGK
jgi:putative NADPH-quinone reductase